MISLSCYQTLFHIIYSLQLLSLWLCFQEFSPDKARVCVWVCAPGSFSASPYINLGALEKNSFCFIFSCFSAALCDLHNNRMHHMFSFHFSHFPTGRIFREFNRFSAIAQYFYGFICAAQLYFRRLFMCCWRSAEISLKHLEHIHSWIVGEWWMLVIQLNSLIMS